MNATQRIASWRGISIHAVLLPLLLPALAAAETPDVQESTQQKTVIVNKQVIGPIATVKEAESELAFKARVDTGATTTSLHVDEWRIEDEAEEMAANVGKTIRFRIKNHRGESGWLEREIVATSAVKTSEQMEERYKVRMKLGYKEMEKDVLVSLNDRSHMNYPVLLGRNFLRGDFVVDVETKKPVKKAESKEVESVAAEEKPEHKG